MTKEQSKVELEQLNIRRSELEAIISKPDVTPEQRFLEILNGCTVRIDKENHSDSIFFFKNGRILFELEISTLWCRYEGVWEVFYREFSMSYAEIQVFIEGQMEKHFKMRGVTSVLSEPWECIRWKNISISKL